jgi:hypothetical protein
VRASAFRSLGAAIATYGEPLPPQGLIYDEVADLAFDKLLHGSDIPPASHLHDLQATPPPPPRPASAYVSPTGASALPADAVVSCSLRGCDLCHRALFLPSLCFRMNQKFRTVCLSYSFPTPITGDSCRRKLCRPTKDRSGSDRCVT